MRLPQEFIRLPLAFDAERLQAEVEAIPEELWRPHPEGHPGNSALPLIAAGGDPMNDTVKGPMSPTPNLERCEYLGQVLAAFGSVLGRSRLMRLDEESEATPHVDTNYYWMGRLRIHVPIRTRHEVEFVCEDERVHMGPGECWVFDTWRLHNVLNPAGGRRIHLVADTVGSSGLWRQIESGLAGSESIELVPHRPGEPAALACERWNFPPVMSPWEQHTLAEPLFTETSGNGSEAVVGRLRQRVGSFIEDWHTIWAGYGPSSDGLAAYQAVLERFDADLGEHADVVSLSNGIDLVAALRQALVAPALSPELAMPSQGPTESVQPAPQPLQAAAAIERPILLVAPPRSGSSLLFETLARSPSAWTVGGESHGVIEGIEELHPASRGFASNRLEAEDANPAVAALLRQRFGAALRGRDGSPADAGAGPMRLLEKTPKNALRIAFFDAVFPDALFVRLHRDPRACIASAIEAWESGRFVTYPGLPGWPGPDWSLALIPGWSRLAGRPLSEIAAAQWAVTTTIMLDDLAQVEPGRRLLLDYDAFVADPVSQINRACEFAGLEWDQPLEGPLPLSHHTVSPPAPEKWRRLEVEIDAALAPYGEIVQRAQAELEARR